MDNNINADILNFCLKNDIIPIELNDDHLHIASFSTDIPVIKETLQFISHKKIKISVWPEAKLLQEKQQLTSPLSINDEPSINRPHQFLTQLLQYALKHRVSDIHIEPTIVHFRIRLRIDGVLQCYPTPKEKLFKSLITFLKIQAKLDIAEQRRPQDGQLSFSTEQHCTCSMRLSTLPTRLGEKAVLRIMDTIEAQPMLSQLGMSPSQHQCMVNKLNKSQGFILVTGPTGSGKSATLYSSLNHINHQQRNLCSIEDPIELPIDGINQSQINPKAGFDFATALRSLLRQDPDVIMIGEIRDKETANIALEAAQTGHLVLATLHTNSTIETIIRLQHMGVERYHLVAALKLIIAQRLVRKLCPICKTESKPITHPSNYSKPHLTHWHASGCEACLGGYYRRTAIFEMLVMTENIQHAILANRSHQEIAKLATQQGMLTLYQQGLQLVSQGETSLSELHRVVDPELRNE